MPEERKSGARWIGGAAEKLRGLGRREEPATRRPRVGLALSGGFARGIAHIGVLRVMEEHKIPIDCLAGTSVGALVGAGYAAGTTLEEMERRAITTKFSDFGRWTLSRLGLATNLRLEEFFHRFTTATRFEQLKIPFAVVATDLGSGKTVHFTSGDLAFAIRASCAYPGLFVPVQQDGRMMADGFLTEPVPYEAARALGAEIVIGVHLETTGLTKRPSSMFEVIGRAFSIMQTHIEEGWRAGCDVVIQPGVADVQWDEFAKTPQMVAAGEAAARLALPQIQALLASPVRRGDGGATQRLRRRQTADTSATEPAVAKKPKNTNEGSV
jgi:NTE family protein